MATYNKKRDQKNPRHQPQAVSAFFYSLVLVFSGACLGFLLFAKHQPQAVADASELNRVLTAAAEINKINPKVAYYLRPPSARGDRWQLIRTALAETNQPVVVAAADVNGWLQSLIIPPPVSADKPMNGLVVKQIQLAFPAANSVQWTISADNYQFGKKFPVVLIFEGDVLSNATGVTFFNLRSRINAAPIPPVPGLQKALLGAILRPLVENHDYAIVQSAFKQAAALKIDTVSNSATFYFDEQLR
jgi:hypothetical protein